MKYVKLLVSLLVGGLMLAACSLIPPQPIGANALGYDGQEITTQSSLVVTGVTPLGSLDRTVDIHFDNVERPEMPIAPSSLQAVQGFTATVVAESGDPLPETITINSGTLTLDVSDDTTNEAVTKTVEFGPFSLTQDSACIGMTCDYSFDDPEAAADTLTASIGGNDLKTLFDIIFDGGANTLTLTLAVNTQESIGSLTFTIDVENNYIRF